MTRDTADIEDMLMEKKALITGINGFVGPYLKIELENNGYEVFGLDLKKGIVGKSFSCDITRYESVFPIINEVRPEYVFHLAGFSSVAKSFKDPELCRKINVEGTRNLLESIKNVRIRPRVLIVSSSDVYGRTAVNPVYERQLVQPVSPYGESRVEQERLAAQYDLPIIMARSFSHTGKGQSSVAVIPSFQKQIEEAPNNGIIYVGNLNVVRDFSDVEDVVKAYRLLLEKGVAGEIYNVGSSIGYNLEEVLKKMVADSGKNLQIKIDTEKIRKNDIPVIIADTDKLYEIIGFKFRKIF